MRKSYNIIPVNISGYMIIVNPNQLLNPLLHMRSGDVGMTSKLSSLNKG